MGDDEADGVDTKNADAMAPVKQVEETNAKKKSKRAPLEKEQSLVSQVGVMEQSPNVPTSDIPVEFAGIPPIVRCSEDSRQDVPFEADKPAKVPDSTGKNQLAKQHKGGKGKFDVVHGESNAPLSDS